MVDVSRRLPRIVSGLAQGGRPVAGLTADEVSAARLITGEDSELWNWPDGWFQAPVSAVLRPRIRHFVERIVPAMAGLAEPLRDLYGEQGVDYVVTPFLGRPVHHFAAIDAARRHDGTRRVQIEHGDSASDAPALALFNLFHFDHYFATSEESAGYFRALSERHRRPLAQVHVGSYRWRLNQQLIRHRPGRRPPVAFTASRPTLVYAITALAGDQRYLNNDFYPDAWYYELQTRIVDVLAADPRFNSVVKLFPGPPAFSGPLGRYVEDKRLPHLRVSRDSFTDWLPWADRVIFDLPSTGLYEAALAGVSFLALLYDGFAFRPGAVAEVEPWTAWFHTADDAAAAVRSFLDVEHPTRPEFQPSGADILTQLEQLAAPH